MRYRYVDAYFVGLRQTCSISEHGNSIARTAAVIGLQPPPPVLVSSRPPSPSAAVDDDAVDTSSSHDSEQLPSSQLNTPVERLERDVQISPPRCQDRLQVAGIQHVRHPMEWTSKRVCCPPPKKKLYHCILVL